MMSSTFSRPPAIRTSPSPMPAPRARLGADAVMRQCRGVVWWCACRPRLAVIDSICVA